MTGWSKLSYKVVDKNTIELKRNDNSEKCTIKKSGEKWNIESHAFDLTFSQAVAMGNFLNYTKDIVKKNRWKGGSERPFEIDGKDIDFDKSGTPFDTTVLDGDIEGSWISFMNRMGITHKKLINMLNNWYQLEYHYVSA